MCVCVYKWHEALVFVCLWNSQRFLTTYCNCHFITMQLIMASLSFSLYLSLWPLLSLSPTLFLYLFIYELTASFFLQSQSIMRTTHDRICPISQLTAGSACAVKACPSSALSVSTPLLSAALTFLFNWKNTTHAIPSFVVEMCSVYVHFLCL